MPELTDCEQTYAVADQHGETHGPFTYYECQAFLTGLLSQYQSLSFKYGMGFSIRRAALLMELFDQYNLQLLPLDLGDEQHVTIAKTNRVYGSKPVRIVEEQPTIF